ncbi:MAG: HypC/HybG/HupF family hydrogenase formation chaperone [Candidatus Korarchaeota archaeon]|nr:HypC/HybG/HupF family hydrogenase formation chaperone [Candidatus Korarchaeota archaeon]NIU83066.1 HypC/HybG/HupF family hydrogenase formation chaperone [Candidatus Thorarchaeota archaeon]NIW12610.1 HypC/HybG/HupF family hydrogenase formation chaperone [Candidatus Thorarchaeota archaeon]NIW50821.1 HypC/HybG/HupF family hydrogenase formation chaperone [Candidatus Korarchaeota archaeon]
MCLGIPAKVVEVTERDALVDYGGVKKKVDAILMQDLDVGDYVIVHAGAIISRISEERYKELVDTLNELAKYSQVARGT